MPGASALQVDYHSVLAAGSVQRPDRSLTSNANMSNGDSTSDQPPATTIQYYLASTIFLSWVKLLALRR